MNYVDGDPANSSETTKAQKPLAAAEVQVEDVEGNPGYYSAKFFLRPHYQLEGVDGGAEPRVEAAVGQGWLVNVAAGPRPLLVKQGETVWRK